MDILRLPTRTHPHSLRNVQGNNNNYPQVGAVRSLINHVITGMASLPIELSRRRHKDRPGSAKAALNQGLDGQVNPVVVGARAVAMGHW